MPAPLIPKEEVLERLTAAFRAHGYEGASLARLSEATGLGRASLYHYFPGGKRDMAAAVLEFVGAHFERLVLAPLGEDGPIGPRLNRMILGLDEFYMRGEAACVWDLFGIGRAGEAFRDELRQSVDHVCAALAEALGRAGVPTAIAKARAEDTVVAFQGALVVARARGDRSVFERVLAELPGRLLADMPPAGG